MNNYYGGSWAPDARPSESLPLGVVNAFLQRVFVIMACGLAVTGAAAWALFNMAFSATPTGIQIASDLYLNPGFSWMLGLGKFVPLIVTFLMVMFIRSALSRMSYAGGTVYFAIYAALTGIGLAPIFAIYTAGSIALTFFITAGMFGAMAIYGMTTKADMTKLGSILIMGLFGIIIASVVNIFLGSNTMQLIISILGVIIFTGLTAYDVQRILRESLTMDANTEEAKKASIMGALILYLDFLNLFLFLLQLLGSRRD